MNSQQVFWKGSGGNNYTKRNTVFENHEYTDGYRLDILKRFLSGIPRHASLLELGCNRGLTIAHLKEMGFTDISGVEVNKLALDMACNRFPESTFYLSSIEDLDIKRRFDMVMTFGVLMHIHPDNLPTVIEKIKSLSKRWIFGNEYYSETCKQLPWKGHLSSDNFPKMFDMEPAKLEIHKKLEEVSHPEHVFYLIEK